MVSRFVIKHLEREYEVDGAYGCTVAYVGEGYSEDRPIVTVRCNYAPLAIECLRYAIVNLERQLHDGQDKF